MPDLLRIRRERYWRGYLTATWLNRVVSMLNDALLVTLAAQVTTVPLMMAYYRQISTVALIVNPLVQTA